MLNLIILSHNGREKKLKRKMIKKKTWRKELKGMKRCLVESQRYEEMWLLEKCLIEVVLNVFIFGLSPCEFLGLSYV